VLQRQAFKEQQAKELLTRAQTRHYGAQTQELDEKMQNARDLATPGHEKARAVARMLKYIDPKNSAIDENTFTATPEVMDAAKLATQYKQHMDTVGQQVLDRQQRARDALAERKNEFAIRMQELAQRRAELKSEKDRARVDAAIKNFQSAAKGYEGLKMGSEGLKVMMEDTENNVPAGVGAGADKLGALIEAKTGGKIPASVIIPEAHQKFYEPAQMLVQNIMHSNYGSRQTEPERAQMLRAFTLGPQFSREKNIEGAKKLLEFADKAMGLDESLLFPEARAEMEARSPGTLRGPEKKQGKSGKTYLKVP
jgi:hypothetical protein